MLCTIYLPVLFQTKTNHNGTFQAGLLTFALNTILDKKIIFFITEDQSLFFLLKTEYTLMDRHLTILAALLSQIKKLGYREVT